MKQYYSAGIVTFTKENGIIKYLILKYAHGHWDLPKGKIEEGETKQEAALRELKEETGINACLIKGFEESLTYHYTELDGEPSRKTVYFFVGLADSTEVSLSEEHIGCIWLTYEEALQKLTYANAKELLKKAHHFIIEQNI